MESSPHIAVGEEFTVLSILVEERSDPGGHTWLLIYDRKNSPTWWPAQMFVTVSTRISSNWVAQLWPDGSFHLAPQAWLKPGFWEDYFDHQRHGPAADTYRAEAEVILREA